MLEFDFDLKNYTNIKKLTTGFSDFEPFLENINSKDSIIAIGGRPSMGKTSFALSICNCLLKEKHKVLYVSLDYSKEEIEKRFIENKIKAKIEKKNSLLVNNAINFYKNSNLSILAQTNLDIEKLEETIKDVKPDFLFIDYIQLLKMPKAPNLTEAIPNCLYIPKLLLSKEDIPNIRKLYSNIALNINDEIFTKIIQSYKRILSFSELTPDEKYRDLVVILENLYIQGETHNIKKKLSSRVAEYFHVFYAQDYNEIYNFTKNAYSIRSSIAHSGESYFDFENKDNNEFLRLLNITRLSILLYVEHMYAFNPDKLKLINFTDNTSSPSHS